MGCQGRAAKDHHVTTFSFSIVPRLPMDQIRPAWNFFHFTSLMYLNTSLGVSAINGQIPPIPGCWPDFPVLLASIVQALVKFSTDQHGIHGFLKIR
jgi:hypothetical protein